MDVKTYTRCDVQLNLFSLLKLTALVGICGGIAWACLLLLLGGSGIMPLTRFDNYFVNFLAFPALGLMFGLTCSLFGYPIYVWFCKQNRGLNLSGIFHNPQN